MRPFLCVLLTVAIPPALTAEQIIDTTIVLSDDFSNPDLDVRWIRQDLARRSTEFKIVSDGDNPVLATKAVRSATALVRPVSTPADGVTLSWRWKIISSLWDNTAERTRRGDDYAARVFVIFGSRLGAPNTRALCYVWSATEQLGEIYPSPYQANVRTIVVQSGGPGTLWQLENRDIERDYLAAFAEPMNQKTIGAVAIMTDADDTRAEAQAMIDDVLMIRISSPAIPPGTGY